MHKVRMADLVLFKHMDEGIKVLKLIVHFFLPNKTKKELT